MKCNLHVRLPTDVNYLLCRHQVCNVIIVIDILNMLKYEEWIMLMAEEEEEEK